jgi:hypothetical protein
MCAAQALSTSATAPMMIVAHIRLSFSTLKIKMEREPSGLAQERKFAVYQATPDLNDLLQITTYLDGTLHGVTRCSQHHAVRSAAAAACLAGEAA